MKKVVIIGAGPAGLGCGYELHKLNKLENIRIIVIDKNDIEGGLARSYKYKDHAIYSGMLAACNCHIGYKKYNIWNINEDAEYLEEQAKN